MSSQQAKVIAALNLALHPNTVDADIVAGVRRAYRLMDGKTVTDFLGLSASQQKLSEELAELRHALGVSEAKLEGAVEYSNELKLEIQRLEEELSKARNEQEKRQQEKENKRLWWQIVPWADERKKPGVAQCFVSLICFMFGLGPSIGIGNCSWIGFYFFSPIRFSSVGLVFSCYGRSRV